MNSAIVVPRLICAAAAVLAGGELFAQEREVDGLVLIELLSVASLDCEFEDAAPLTVEATADEPSAAEPTVDESPAHDTPAGRSLAAGSRAVESTAGRSAGDGRSRSPVSMAFRSIDVSAATAGGGDPSIAGNVRVMPTNLGLHFYQFDETGELSLVTVAARRDESGRYAAVLSRHHAGRRMLEPSQLAGTCAAAAYDD